jgi:hypothetical protein
MAENKKMNRVILAYADRIRMGVLIDSWRDMIQSGNWTCSRLLTELVAKMPGVTLTKSTVRYACNELNVSLTTEPRKDKGTTKPSTREELYKRIHDLEQALNNEVAERIKLHAFVVTVKDKVIRVMRELDIREDKPDPKPV